MKKGITITSLIIYIICFFTLTMVGLSISSNLTYKFHTEKKEIIANENYIKIYSNLLNSAKSSYNYDIINDRIIFSNGDIYMYADNKFYKNKAILSGDIENVTNIDLNSEIGNHIDTNICFGLRISFFGLNSNKEIYITVGDDIE